MPIEPNYFLYMVGTDTPKLPYKRGDCGVGRTQRGPGICDAPYGTMYVVPAKYMHECANTRYPHPQTIRHYIEKYYFVRAT